MFPSLQHLFLFFHCRVDVEDAGRMKCSQLCLFGYASLLFSLRYHTCLLFNSFLYDFDSSSNSSLSFTSSSYLVSRDLFSFLNNGQLHYSSRHPLYLADLIFNGFYLNILIKYTAFKFLLNFALLSFSSFSCLFKSAFFSFTDSATASLLSTNSALVSLICC